MPTPEQLEQLAKEFLNEKCQEYVAELLDNDNLHRAKYYLLGYIDGMFDNNDITGAQAQKCYEILQITGEKASRVRQNNASTSKSN
jgi:hypothetical protein